MKVMSIIYFSLFFLICCGKQNEKVQTIDNIQTLHPRKKKSSKLSSSKVKYTDFARLDSNNENLYHRQSHMNGIIHAEQYSPVVEIRMLFPDELIKISGRKLYLFTSGNPLIFDKYTVKIIKEKGCMLRLEVQKLLTLKDVCAFNIPVRDDNILYLAPCQGLVGLSSDTDVTFKPDRDMKFLLITDEFRSRFSEHKSFEMHYHEKLITWSIPFKLYPINIDMPELDNITCKIVMRDYKYIGDILPDYFPPGKYYTRKDIFGPPPAARPPSGLAKNSSNLFYEKYRTSLTGYNNNKDQRIRYCRKHKIIVAFDKKHNRKRFYCPVDGEELR